MSLPERLIELPSFQETIRKLTIHSVRSLFPNLRTPVNTPIDFQWPYLLFCASILAQSGSSKCQAAALRIAHSCLGTDATEEAKIAAGIVFDMMANQPAIDLAVRKGLLASEFKSRLPHLLFSDSLKRATKFTVELGAKEVLLNPFQMQFIDALESAQYVSVSAPTSSGKSFILNQYVCDYIGRKPRCRVVYIVPTRALIQQVEQQLQILSKELVDKPIITTVPQLPLGHETRSVVFVFTQERLRWLLNEIGTELNVDLLVVDEAQKIGDGARGILLQQAIQDIVGLAPEAKAIFSSPMTRNPDVLLEDMPPSKRGQPVRSAQVTVNQNLIWVSQVPRNRKRWQASLILQGALHQLGTIDFDRPLTSHTDQIVGMALALGDSSGGNLLYVNGAAEAERIATALMGRVPHEDHVDEEIAELVNLVKRTIHPTYALAQVLPRRIAFHYGNMPLLVRTEIERLFKEGKIAYLICTSTLMEGVNLPGRSIFLHSPQKGMGHAIEDIDFWNLAGRAGRLGKEFQGNVFCIAPESWDKEPPKERHSYEITRTIDRVVAHQERLIEFISNDAPRTDAKKDPALEHAFVYFYNHYLEDNRLETVRALSKYPRPFLMAIQRLCQTVEKTIQIPKEIIRRNPGISPLALRSLLNYFEERGHAPASYIPPHPAVDDAYQKYVGVIGRISSHLSGDPPALTSYRAVLVTNWMNGYSLPRIINQNISYWKKHDERKKVPQIIRGTMTDIEQFVRFSFAKYCSCYVDVLRYFFESKGFPGLAAAIPPINLWLEFGACQKTQLSFLSLGFSRHSAVELSQLAENTELDREQCADWLKTNRKTLAELPALIYREVERIVGIL